MNTIWSFSAFWQFRFICVLKPASGCPQTFIMTLFFTSGIIQCPVTVINAPINIFSDGQAVHQSFVNPAPWPWDGWLWSWSVMLRALHRYWTTSFWFHTMPAEVMHQSILTTCIPTGPGNSGDIDFSLCKARVYAWHCGDSLMPSQSTAQIPAVKCEITSASLGMECWGQKLALKRRIS